MKQGEFRIFGNSVYFEKAKYKSIHRYNEIKSYLEEEKEIWTVLVITRL